MQSVVRRGVAPALLIAFTVFGVLLMHSVAPVMSMSGGHDTAVHIAEPVAFGEHHAPSDHQMMHPCVGTTASWPALTTPTASTEVSLCPPSEDRIDGRTISMLERAPPWTLWELDRSVTLRV